MLTKKLITKYKKLHPNIPKDTWDFMKDALDTEEQLKYAISRANKGQEVTINIVEDTKNQFDNLMKQFLIEYGFENVPEELSSDYLSTVAKKLDSEGKQIVFERRLNNDYVNCPKIFQKCYIEVIRKDNEEDKYKFMDYVDKDWNDTYLKMKESE